MTDSIEYRWRKTDESVDLAHCPDHEQSYLYYGRTYTIGEGYNSTTNQLILNFKISISEVHRNSARKRYKYEAIKKFSSEVVDFLATHRSSDPSLHLTLVPIPPSKSPDDPGYDDRMEQVTNLIAEKLGWVTSLPMLRMIQSMESYHSRSEGRNSEEIYNLLKIDENLASSYQANSILALMDDVVASGAHFEAARRRIQENFPQETVIGIFWAKAIKPPIE